MSIWVTYRACHCTGPAGGPLGGGREGGREEREVGGRWG